MIVAEAQTGESILGYEDLLVEVGAPAPTVDIPADSPALIMYTSGTTGNPREPCSPTPTWPDRP